MTPWTSACQVSLSSLSPEVCPSSCPWHQWYHSYPLLLLPSIFPSIRDFSNESSIHIQWPKYWSFSFSFSISLSSEYSGLIFRQIDCFNLLAVQETFRNLLQHHSSKASILWCSAFFMVQLSQPYMTTGKTIALTIWTFVSNVSAFQHSLGLSSFSCQEAIVFWFHGCSCHPCKV